MAEVAASALLKFVFDKLSSAALTEFELLVGVDKHLRKLESTLSVLQDVLEDAEAKQMKEKALKGWLRKLKDVAYDIDDVLDEYAAEAKKWRPEIERRKKDKVRSFCSKPISLVVRHKIARRIKEIRERLDDIAEERAKFHLRVEDRKEEIRPRETGSFVDESKVYGRQIDREKITDFLINPSWSEDDLGVTAIVGLGGLGKTTVAQLVYNDDRVCEHFDQRMWVCVSDEFDIGRLSRSIIESATREKCNLVEMDSVQYSLRKLLEGKRFLLVLDDVWNENQQRWDGFRTLLTSGAKGSKIVVTTRSERVASIMGAAQTHVLKGLSESDCWLLFERFAFGSGEAAENPNLVAIGKEIVKKCGGVPLAAKALGSLMRFKRRESEWLSVKNNEIWEMSDDENEILPALMLSYNHLPSRLKQCFAYCSIFPKDYEVSKEELVQLWIAEGFIRSPDMNTQLEDVGYQSVDELLSRSLFQNGREDLDGVVREVKMHDLVHDLAQYVAGDECSIIDAGTGRGVSESLRYSSFLYNKEISAFLEPLDQAKKLRTFYLIHPDRWSREQDKIHELPHVFFSSLKLLRALHMSNYPMKGLSDSIKKLKHLRYLNLQLCLSLETLPPCIGILQNLQTLNLSFCELLRALPDTICDLHNLQTLNLNGCKNLLSLPPCIGMLQNLQTLNLSYCELLRALPDTICDLHNLSTLDLNNCDELCELPESTRNMRNLVHLDIQSCLNLTCMPAGIGEMNCLRTLPIFILGGKNRSSLEELGGLNLEGKLNIKNLENVRDAAESRGAKLKDKQRLKSLQFEWGPPAYMEQKISREGIDRGLGDAIEALVMRDWDADAELAEDALEGLQPHTDLEVLCIEGYFGRGLPRWMMELSLPNLVKVSLTSCYSCECLPAFGKLPYLKVLKLFRLPAVKILDSEFYGADAAFPLLKEFELGSMTALEEWMGPSGGEVMPCLSKLRLRDCPELKALPSSFPSVKELGMDVDDAMLLSSLQDGAFPNLSRLYIGNRNGGDEDDMPEVLRERLASIRSWSLRIKNVHRGDDSTTMYGTGTNILEIYLL